MPDNHNYELTSVSEDGANVLPKAHAKAAIIEFFDQDCVTGVETTHDRQMVADRCGLQLDDGQWAILLPATAHARRMLRRVLPDAELENVHAADGMLVLIQPSRSIHLEGRSVRHLKRALDSLRPHQANGLPYPWVVPESATEALGRPPDEHDVVVDPQVQPEPEDPEFSGKTELTSETIRADFDSIRRHLSLPDFPLVIRRGAVHKHGFVTGRVHMLGGKPSKMTITTCPNSDRAEAAATLAHEFAHVLLGASGHDLPFKRALVELAEGTWGAPLFVSARRALDQSYRVVDAWVVSGIRAKLGGGGPPVEAHIEEAQMVVAVRRVQKLRALALDQLGTPEGCLAAAKANDLIVTRGLTSYEVALPTSLGAEMCDQWIFIGKRKPWKASIAFAVAEFCDVFALAHKAYGGMHFFGSHADVVTAEYLCSVAIERIESRCQRHIEQWRAQNPGPMGGAVVSERTSFLHSAADGLATVLEQAKVQSRDDSSRTGDSDAIQAAEHFARVEHDKRGRGWRGGSGVERAHNSAGYEAGSSLTLSRGIGGRGRPKGLLT